MANFLSNIFSSFSSEKAESVLGIDIGSSSIKIVQLKKKGGKAVLETYGEIALGPYAGTDLGRAAILPADKIAEALKDVLKESNTTTVNCGISIPIGSSFVSFIRLPTSDERSLPDMVPLEARKYIPVPISEVTLDWWAVPKDESTVSEFRNGEKTPEAVGTEVLLVVITNDAIRKNQDIQKLSAINATFSEVEIFSTMRAVLEPAIAPVMIMDFGAGSTKVFIVERGILRASHVVNRGGQDITLAIAASLSVSFVEAEKTKRAQGLAATGTGPGIAQVSSVSIDYIFAEAGRFVLDYYRKSDKKISRVILTGGGALLKGLPEKAQAAFGAPVEVADPFGKVAYPAFLANVLKTAGPEFTAAIGLAIRKLQES
ncbi:MAG: type IV pilus assembly protein PilM [Patescibacteria group bacterium]|nr:type IV pilus assembly protein PilM [Patescibacteria group bacterium]MDE1945631.1 type IV pilus assembly protein PilM [Patescibacteria group bacterium]